MAPKPQVLLSRFRHSQMETRLLRHSCPSPGGTCCADAYPPACTALPSSSGSAVLVRTGLSPSPRGSLPPRPRRPAPVPDRAAVAPISHWSPPMLAGLCTLRVQTCGEGYVYTWATGHIYTVHIYIQHIYIFLHSYIYCTEHSPSTKNSFVTSRMALALKF